MKTIVISAFPGCGKSYVYNNFKDEFEGILDSDSSQFSWVKDKDGNNTKERNPEFPKNYIDHIKENIGKVEVIFVSSHKEVRDCLKLNEIEYVLVFPLLTMKEEFIERFRSRGNDEAFITFISNNWKKFIDELFEEEYPTKFVLNDLSKHIFDMLFIQTPTGLIKRVLYEKGYQFEDIK